MRWRGCSGAIQLLEGPFPILLHGMLVDQAAARSVPHKQGAVINPSI